MNIIATFCYVERKFVWYLGVADGLDPESDRILISYLKQTDKEGFEWEFPEHADIQPISEEEILVSSIAVTYMSPVKVQCRIRCEDRKPVTHFLYIVHAVF